MSETQKKTQLHTQPSQNSTPESFSDYSYHSYFDELPRPLALESTVGSFFSKVGDKMRNHAFVFALIIVPLSSASTGFTITEDAPEFHAVNHYVLNDTVLELDEEIIFQFEQPYTASQEVDVKIHPQTPFAISWNDDYTQLTIEPRTTWKSHEDYSMGLTQGPEGTSGVIYHFTTESYPQILRTTPESGAEFEIIDHQYEISMHLDRNLSDYDFNIVSRINTIAETEILAEQKMITLHFTQDLTASQDVEIVVYAKHKSDPSDNYFPIGQFDFKALAPQPTEWPEEGEDRVLLSQEKTTPKITDGKYIDINIAARITTLFENGKAVHAFINSPGAEDTPTPTGHFTIHNKAEKPLSQMFNVYLPFWMAFTEDGKYGIHDLIEWPEDHPEKPEGRNKESLRSIDSAVSPGCVRHTPEHSQQIYEWAEVGTKVVIY